MGDLIVSGKTYITSISGIYLTSVFGISAVNSLTYGSPPSVTVDNTSPNNPKLTFGIPAGKPSDNPNFQYLR